MAAEEVASPVLCPTCKEPVEEGDRFCEACGAELSASPGTAAADLKPCAECGAPGAEIDADGYCGQCGYDCRDYADALFAKPASIKAVK